MTSLDDDMKIYFMQDIIFKIDNNGDATAALSFFDASKEEQLEMFNAWTVELQEAKRIDLEQKKQHLQTLINELDSDI